MRHAVDADSDGVRAAERDRRDPPTVDGDT